MKSNDTASSGEQKTFIMGEIKKHFIFKAKL